ncbi:DJ-1/PfpI family protein [Phyllobacterium sp. P30BS-XVII]|uniref:DJ-1/PfpI family protein n=1 Tax=Phyllobacterium sp. P30BS-XVII TaxID=2587046 RepID=UPI0015FBA010|nr:DJ-1/PfpI family protein [Phyllobacterium sp. P30BS-XVII]MBA8902452.1 putative intracellular protease/amidase [Phyllobacterium sp. P30BS-XVII]
MADLITIVIPIYNGVTHLDFTGPHQFMSRLPDTKVIVASMNGEDVGADGLVFSGLSDLSAIERCDVLFVPGGSGCTGALQNEAFVAAIRRLGLSAQYITSVCTGSLILGAAGLLKGKRAACHWAWRDMLLPFGAIPDTDRVVRDGNILTGGGVTAGIDFVLTLIAELRGDEAAQRIQLMLEYAPAPPFNAGRPDTAPQAIVDAVLSWMQPFVQQRHDEVALAAARLTG